MCGHADNTTELFGRVSRLSTGFCALGRFFFYKSGFGRGLTKVGGERFPVVLFRYGEFE